MEPHKRTKSTARSLLQRVSSRRDVRKESTDNASLAPSESAPTAPLTPDPSAPIAPVAMPPPSAPVAPSSIEASVRLFRVYEALRSGDTAAISKALKDNSAADPTEGRASISSINTSGLEGTTVLHLAVQCADVAVIEYIIASSSSHVDVNARDRDGNTPLHIAAMLSRAPVVRLLLDQKHVDDTIANYQGRTPLDLAKNPEVFQQLQLARSLYIEGKLKQLHILVAKGDYASLENELADTHLQKAIDVNGGELATEPQTVESGGTLLHEAARKKDAKLIQILLLNGADPFKRDRKGKLPQDITKDDKIRTLLKKSPEAAAAQRGIQEKTILGSGTPAHASTATGENALGGKEGREMKGYLKKWTNYTSGYKLRWFVLEDGVLSYYKHQDDISSACRGAINMRIAQLHMDAQDKLRFEILGKSSVKYHLKANHQVEAKRWFWALNNAIQFAKDEAKEEKKRSDGTIGHGKPQVERQVTRDSDSVSISGTKLAAPAGALQRLSLDRGEETGTSVADTSNAGDEFSRLRSQDTTAIEGDLDDEIDLPDEASSLAEAHPVNRDAFMIAAQSARLQLDLLAQISAALQAERVKSPETTLSHPSVVQALASYEAAVANLRGLVGDLGRIARDRESYWQYRLEQEVNVRRIWEENMAHIAKEQEELENRIGESEEKRKATKRALRDALEGREQQPAAEVPAVQVTRPRSSSGRSRRATTTAVDLADSDSEDDAEFFDAVDAGEVKVVEQLPPVETPVDAPPVLATSTTGKELRVVKQTDVSSSFKGYEEPLRKRLKLDADDRPKISLWGILKSMIGKDMTKMTLPVSFNEPTSLLQRVAEDMEYTDLLDIAADRPDSLERLVYVAAFAASEYGSTVGRVAKPFNPLLGETYEYVRPDKQFRFFIEQVSHHPPIGAAWAESPKWDYWGESSVQSKFYGKSFDINPLGTWFLKLRPSSGGPEELYTWKKVTSSVIGIITGNPTIDNYGPMEVKNWTTGETCILNFVARGWKASSAYQVAGKITDAQGNTKWSMGGRWNDKIYARLTPGYEVDPSDPKAAAKGDRSNQAVLVWEANPRPTGIPFNLTPFVVTLNALTDSLKPVLPPTDTRLRPDQRAMEDGEYDFAAVEKNRVENKQRAARREREAEGVVWTPKWFTHQVDPTTGEKFWDVRRDAQEDAQPEYWRCREKGDWSRCDDIF